MADSKKAPHPLKQDQENWSEEAVKAFRPQSGKIIVLFFCVLTVLRLTWWLAPQIKEAREERNTATHTISVTVCQPFSPVETRKCLVTTSWSATLAPDRSVNKDQYQYCVWPGPQAGLYETRYANDGKIWDGDRHVNGFQFRSPSGAIELSYRLMPGSTSSNCPSIAPN